MPSVESKVKNRILKKKAGWHFTPHVFFDLGASTAVRQALSRLERAGFIKRLAKGIYYYPIIHEKLGELPPSTLEIAKAIALRDQAKIQPSGAYAANLLGLSTQVPSQSLFLTDGATKKVQVDAQTIIFKHTSLKNMKMAGTKMGLIVQALKHVGQENFTDDMRNILNQKILAEDITIINKYLKFTPEWIRIVLESIIEEQHG